ncbi:MAG: CARDB domain-containing protein, partial [Solirubrobacteraceae bacterium]
YPSLSASSSGEVAMTYFTGAGTAKYPNMGVGFLTNKEYFVRVATGAKGRARIGDYQAVRPARPSSKRYSAAGYVLDSSNNFHPWWALFGRSSDKPATVIKLPPIIVVPPPPPPPPPDLIVGMTSSSITVRNQGAGPAGPFTAVIVDSNSVTLSFSFTGLAAGASATRTFTCDDLSRQRTAVVDSGRAVAETNESNNTASGVFACPVP